MAWCSCETERVSWELWLEQVSKQQLYNSKFVSIHKRIFCRFEHPKDKVNAGKQKVIKDMKEELSDMTVELLNMLKLSGKKIEYSPWQQQQQSMIVEEIKFLSKKDLGEFALTLQK